MAILIILVSTLSWGSSFAAQAISTASTSPDIKQLPLDPILESDGVAGANHDGPSPMNAGGPPCVSPYAYDSARYLSKCVYDTFPNLTGIDGTDALDVSRGKRVLRHLAGYSAILKATRGGQNLARNFAAGQLEKHFGKHAAEWGAGNITKEAYAKRAADLLGREPGGNILGATRANGDILRYNARTNEFAAGAADGTIRTLFRPTDGVPYWLRQVP